MSEADLAALYQELILDHHRRPRNKGTLLNPDASISMKNPLCGDEIELQLSFEGDTVKEVTFAGHGCSISQASASMMTSLIKGKQAHEIALLGEQFRQMMLGDKAAATDKRLGELRALSGVARFPARVKCALLAWNALTEGMEQQQ